jgi:hypothetical protein
MNELHRAKEILAALPAIPLAQSLGVHTEVFYEGECYLCKIWFGTNPNRKPLPVHDKFVLDVAALPVLETPAEAVFCDHSQWRECAATLEMVRDLSDKALNYTAAYDLANDLAAILAGYDDAIPGAPVEPVPVPRSILQGMKFEALSDGFRVTPLEPIDFLGTECFFDGGKVGSWNIEGEIRFTYSAPVPAPRLEWREGAGLESTHWYGVGPNAEDEYDRWTVAHLYETYDVSYAAGRIQKRCKTLDAAKSLAEKLNDVLSPPVGTQEKEN